MQPSNGDLQATNEMMQMITAHWLSRSIQVAAELGVADLIEDKPVPAAGLAKSSGVQPELMDRVLRFLSSWGIFRSTDHAYEHTDLSRLLRSDHPHSLRPFARFIGSPMMWGSFGALLDVMKTGRPATASLDPAGVFGYLKSHPAESSIFNAAMEAKARRDIAAVLQSYDFSRFKNVADIGGGRGHLLAAILGKNPGLRGILFDQPHVVSEAPAVGNMTVQGGDFFAGSLPKAEAYLLMEVLHDWADTQALDILRSVRKAAGPGAKLLIIETVMPEGNERHYAKGLDITMMVVTGGRERTADEWESLLTHANFRLERIVATESVCSVIEASVAG